MIVLDFSAWRALCVLCNRRKKILRQRDNCTISMEMRRKSSRWQSRMQIDRQSNKTALVRRRAHSSITQTTNKRGEIVLNILTSLACFQMVVKLSSKDIHINNVIITSLTQRGWRRDSLVYVDVCLECSRRVCQYRFLSQLPLWFALRTFALRWWWARDTAAGWLV